MTIEEIRRKYGVPAYRRRSVWYTPPGMFRWVGKHCGTIVEAVRTLGGDRVVWRDGYGKSHLADPLHLTCYEAGSSCCVEWCAVENRKTKQ